MSALGSDHPNQTAGITRAKITDTGDQGHILLKASDGT